MQDIFDSLMQDIEQGASSHFNANAEYHQNRHYVLKHLQWLADHLDSEAKEHLEKARDAESYVDTLEREAIVRTALAVGIRLALCR